MQSYINHLLSDIAEACREEQPETYSSISAENDMEAIERYFEEVERWLENEPEHDFSYYSGLQKEQFPPVEKLSNEQMAAVSLAFERLLFTWNIGVEMPDKLPISRKYSLLVSVLERKVAIVENGFETIEFCSYDPPSCPFNEWCTCKELGLKDQYNDDGEDVDPDNLSF
ncbi:hypothetical protein FAM09_07280 [Niastella caeni]|uniref:Uncharacterized protein n=1 Tax=Niastella caeni TaxID=2569763 RepID=A0A4S8I3X5_9BACT|nr:hypothetical protein [Niastella caeni]THU41894.1 hypothetical protein FAM09_07280 [Niastella caeni]